MPKERKKQTKTHSMNNENEVIDGDSPSGQYVWIGDQYIPVEDLI